MKREIRYLTLKEIDGIFQDVYATAWPGPKISEDDELFAQLIQEASMKINGIQVPKLNSDGD